MADPEEDNPDRPSFTSFWKRSKEALTARKITFVPSTTAAAGPSAGSSSSTAAAATADAAFSNPAEYEDEGLDGDHTTEDPSQLDKAQLRRAQVRKAQIQHRQRKANYVKQLEIDIAKLRDLISGTQRDTDTLRVENEAMRNQIQDAVGQLAAPAGLPAEPLPPVGKRVASDGIMMGLEFDRVLNAPSYRVAGSPVDESRDSRRNSTPRAQVAIQKQSQPRSGHFEPPTPTDMSAEQTELAINFILALEHICWDHFDYSDFQPNTEPTGPESGHTLMASTLALRTAPASVFDGVITTKQNMRSPNPSTRQTPIPPDVSWRASGLTLQSLYGLASSVNLSDLDLTPVQAWFELAAEYPTGLLLRPDIMNMLKTELIGVVKCPHYGAVIERTAFESIVRRILDPALAVWRMERLGQGVYD